MPLSLNLSLPLLLQLSRAAWQVWFMFSYGKDHGSQQPPTAARFWWGSAARLQHIQYEKTVCTVQHLSHTPGGAAHFRHRRAKPQ